MFRPKRVLVGLAVPVLLAAPANADIWWETNWGTLYWETTVDTYSVFQFFLGNSTELDPSFKIFVDGTSQMNTLDELAGKTFGGIWYDYENGGCGFDAWDPYAQRAPSWGQVTITFSQDPNYFSAVFKDCSSHEVYDRVNGSPGR